jgi:hypothetical protein
LYKENLAALVTSSNKTADMSGVARFFLVQHTQTEKNIPNDHKYTKWPPKYTKWSQNIPNDRKMDKMPIKHTDISKSYPNWVFWFENIPSGNPGYQRWHLQKMSTSIHFYASIK